jgi:DHA2 family multidrug resistance protein
MALMPLVGFLLSKYAPRNLLIFGWAWTAFALFRMTNFDLDMDFHTAAMARVVQAVGLAFLFVPINTAAYAYLPREKSNQASGLINLARNIGGSVGISFVTTMLDRRAQFHQARMIDHLGSGSWKLHAALEGTARTLQAHGSAPALAAQQAQQMIQNSVVRQATMLAYIDNFKILAISAMCMVPLVLLLKGGKPGGELHVH